MTHGEPEPGSAEADGVGADHGGVAAGRDIRGGVHTGPEVNISIAVGDLRDRGQVIEMVQEVKQVFQRATDPAQAAAAPPAAAMPMQSFQATMTDPYEGGSQWLPQIQQVAAQQGSSWVPQQTQGFAGIDLTGVWVPPGNMWEQDYVRQFGPYLNMITGVGSMPTGYSEGLFDPASGIIRLAGQYANGSPLEAALQLFPNWTLQGWVSGIGPFGPMTTPVFLTKVG